MPVQVPHLQCIVCGNTCFPMCLQKRIPEVLRTWFKNLSIYLWFIKVLYFVEGPRILELVDNLAKGSTFLDSLFRVPVPVLYCGKVGYTSSVWRWCSKVEIKDRFSVTESECLRSLSKGGNIWCNQLWYQLLQSSSTWGKISEDMVLISVEIVLSCLVGIGYSQFSFHLLRNLIFWCPSIPATVQKEINRINVCYWNMWMSDVPFLSLFANEGEETSYNFV